MAPEAPENSKANIKDVLEFIIVKGHNGFDTKQEMAHHLILFLRYCVLTQDEHDHENAFKPLPFDVKPFLEVLALAWIEQPLIVIGKSRQLMVTWIYCAIWLWDAMFRKGRLNITISKKEEDADKLIKRMAGIYDRLPETIKQQFPVKPTPKGETSAYCKWNSLKTAQ